MFGQFGARFEPLSASKTPTPLKAQRLPLLEPFGPVLGILAARGRAPKMVNFGPKQYKK